MAKRHFKLYYSKPGTDLLVKIVSANDRKAAVRGFKWTVHEVFEVNEVGAIIG